jgi:hypothetical protein
MFSLAASLIDMDGLTMWKETAQTSVAGISRIEY